MEQDRAGREVAVAGVWAEGRDKAEVVWAGLSPQDPAEIAHARNVDVRFHMLQVSRVIRGPARNVERKCQDSKQELFLKGELSCHVETEQVLPVWDR